MSNGPEKEAFASLCTAMRHLKRTGTSGTSIFEQVETSALKFAQQQGSLLDDCLDLVVISGSKKLLMGRTWAPCLMYFMDLEQFLKDISLEEFSYLLSCTPYFDGCLTALGKGLIGKPDHQNALIAHIRSCPTVISRDCIDPIADVQCFSIGDTEEDTSFLAQLLQEMVEKYPVAASIELHSALEEIQDQDVITLLLAGAIPSQPVPLDPENPNDLTNKVSSAHGRLEVIRKHGPLSKYLAQTAPF